MKTNIMKKIGYGCALVIIMALLLGLECVIAKLVGMTIHEVPYITYWLDWMGRHPIITCIEGMIMGVMLVIGVDVLVESE